MTRSRVWLPGSSVTMDSIRLPIHIATSFRVTCSAISPLFHGVRSLNNSAWVAQDTSDGVVTKTSSERSLAPFPSPPLSFSSPLLAFLSFPYSFLPPIPSYHLPFPFPPVQILLSSPFLRLGGMGERLSSPSGSVKKINVLWCFFCGGKSCAILVTKQTESEVSMHRIDHSLSL